MEDWKLSRVCSRDRLEGNLAFPGAAGWERERKRKRSGRGVGARCATLDDESRMLEERKAALHFTTRPGIATSEVVKI